MNKDIENSTSGHEPEFERVHFKKLLSANPNYFGNLDKTAAGIANAIAYNVGYEEITSIGYNPATEIMEATIDVKKSYGFSGGLCTNGSYNYVRFYLNYGTGWEDQGFAGFNAHDIPTDKDCTKADEKPLSYVITLKINPKKEYCEKTVTPKARAILSWNVIPPANTPNYTPVWGNVYECNIQIGPRPKFKIFNPDFEISKVLELAINNPLLSLAQAAEAVPEGKNLLSAAAGSLQVKEQSIAELINIYKDPKLAVSAGRFGLKLVKEIQYNPDITIASQQIEYIKKIGFDWDLAVNEILQTSANTSYEELTNVGLDYNKEQFVASVHVKKPSGYSGNLCSAGSYEYVAFWADWDNNCEWEYVGTASVNVHDLGVIPEGGLCYSATLPYNFQHRRKKCSKPNVVKVRAVLSWNIPPSVTNPNNLKTWGNLLDRYIQVKPGEEIPVGTVKPFIYVLGGIPEDKVSNASGVTTAGASFALNAVPVEPAAPFAGIVVIQGPSFPGYKYRIKVTNLATSAFYYLIDPLWLVGYGPSPVPPHNAIVKYKTINADSSGFYDFQNRGTDFDENVDNVLARWTPGTNDKWQIDLEIQGVPGVFTKLIQMDNTLPKAILDIDNNGDCTFYKLGDTITGHFTATDDYISSYQLSSSFVGTIESGTVNTTNNSFAFTTNPNGTPCGSIGLVVFEKTIHNSSNTGAHTPVQEIVCLKPKA
ncbi:MAG: hypothetical protein H7Z13_01305 [Ferruginibacter sp.]|nr:hypothetical protein [Ferruginibacter sp.]